MGFDEMEYYWWKVRKSCNKVNKICLRNGTMKADIVGYW